MKNLLCIIALLFSWGCSSTDTATFPDFITPNEEYFVTRIDGIPDIDEDTYELTLSGTVENPAVFTLDELRALNLVDIPLTIECIGNRPGGPLVGTAVWKGFRLIDLLQDAGIEENATGVTCTAADGYYASYTLEQLSENNVIGALYMNGEPLPPVQGFPLRIILPGYYGAKQAAWVTGIEVIDRPLEDFWEDFGWDLTPPMDIDSTFFFPENNSMVRLGTLLAVGGAAFGGGRIKKVELTTDDGASWQEADIVQSMDADNVWVFWEAELTFDKPGRYTIYSKATDHNGITQPRNDYDRRDGNNTWPSINVTVSGL